MEGSADRKLRWIRESFFRKAGVALQRAVDRRAAAPLPTRIELVSGRSEATYQVIRGKVLCATNTRGYGIVVTGLRLDGGTT